MRYLAGFLAAAVLTIASPLETRQSGSGSGPYGPGTYKTDNSLSGHTIYYPTNAPSTEKLPVLVWGNGACSTDGRSNSALLQNIASYGFIAIAEGGPNGGGTSDASTMATAINWAAQSQSGWPNKDGSKIMAAGFSCGGVEAEDNFQNQYVKTIGVVSSGLLSNTDAAKNFKKPVLFILGGSSDIAYQNGERDYSNVPSGIPAWKGNINVGHGGTLGDKDGGRFGKVLLNWLLYTFKGQQSGLDYLKGGYSADGWSVQSKSLDQLKPFGGSGSSTTASPTTTAAPTSTTTRPAATTTASGGGGGGGAALYGQCGGQGWTGATTCAQGTCKYSNAYYSQCLP